jgi:hypothetical protein
MAKFIEDNIMRMGYRSGAFGRNGLLRRSVPAHGRVPGILSSGSNIAV